MTMENTLLTIFMSKKRKILFGVMLLCILCIGCSDQENKQGNETVIIQDKLEESLSDNKYLSQIALEEEKTLKQEEDNNVDIEQWNPYFFPMENDTETIQVFCEFNNFAGEGEFLGTAFLQINRIPGTANYYELILTNLTGECDFHDHFANADGEKEPCVYTSDFHIGYFYVDKENIYQMSYYKEYLELFKESEGFLPSEEAINEYNNSLKEAGKHYGYFGYELVCSSQGVKDTFDMSQEEIENLPDGVCNHNTSSKQYHNYIEVDGDEIKYNLYPDEIVGNDTYHYIKWQENKGMTFYASWTGNLKGYICFYVDRDVESPLAARRRAAGERKSHNGS